jgi:hypothetical protein
MHKYPKGYIKKQRELLHRHYGRCWMVPVTAEIRQRDEFGINLKTARNRVEYYFKTGTDRHSVHEIVEKLLS